MEAHGQSIAPWKYVEFHGNPWKSIENQWKPMQMHWKTMEIHGNPWKSMKSMEINGNTLQIHGNP